MGDSGSGHAALYRALAKATAIEHGTAARRIALAGEKIELSRQSAATITDTHRKENGPTDFASRLARAWRFFSWEIRQAYIKAISLWLGIAEIFRLEDYAVAPAPDTPSWFDAFTAFFRDLRELYTTRTRNEVEHFVARSVFSVPRAAATAEAEWQTFLERLQGGGRLGVPVSGEAGGRVTGIAIAFVQRAWNEDADLPPEIDEVEDKSAIRAAAEKRAALAQERRQRELLIDVIPPDWLFHIVPREGDPAATHLRPALQGQERLVRPEVPNVPAHPLNVQSLVFFSGHPIHNIPFAGEWQIRLPAEFTGPDVEDPIVWRDDAGVWQTDLEDIIVYFRVRRRTPKREDASIDVF